MEIDHYCVLGLPTGKEGAELTREEIATAYRRKCKELHPDKRPGNSNAHAEFVKLQESYEILKDAAKRKSFDHLMAKKINQGIKRQRQQQEAPFQERETKRPAQAKTRIQRFNLEEIRQAVFADIPVRRKGGVQVSCGKDDQEIKIQSFPKMKGVWIELR